MGKASPGRASAINTTVNVIVGLITLAIFALGFITLVHWITGLVSTLRVPTIGFLSDAGKWIYSSVKDHPDGWLTGIATFFVWRATEALRGVASRQSSVDAPFLFVDLAVQIPGTPNALNPHSYPTDYLRDDKANDELQHYYMLAQRAHVIRRFVTLEIENEQEKPNGIAAQIVVIASLEFPGRHGQVTITRTAQIPVLGSGKRAAGLLFDVTALPRYDVRIYRLSYYDVAKKLRQAGYGTGKLSEDNTGNLTKVDAVFEIGKNEI